MKSGNGVIMPVSHQYSRFSNVEVIFLKHILQEKNVLQIQVHVKYKGYEGYEMS